MEVFVATAALLGECSQAIEPTIGHPKADHRMDRCWLQDATGDALHAVLCAAGYNLRWLLRAVVRGRIRRFFFAFWSETLQLLLVVSVMRSSSRGRSAPVIAAAS